MRYIAALASIVIVLMAFGHLVRAADAAKEARTESKAGSSLERDKEALMPLQVFVGQWRGVGQPRRGSTAGAWTEKSDWSWKFEKDSAALAFVTPTEPEKGAGKYFVAGRLERAEKDAQFRFIATLPDGKTEIAYVGGRDKEGRLVVATNEAPEGWPGRIAFRTVAEGERLLILYERRLGKTENFTRIAEVGYTREGGNFARLVVERECVVTGGAGTIQVTHKGQTYWVCCTGCRDLFNDDPEGALAEYRARKEAEKKKK